MSSVNAKIAADKNLDAASVEARAAADLAGDAAKHTAQAAKIEVQQAAQKVEQKWEEVKPALKSTFNQGKDADLVAAELERKQLESS
ncbi:hypothetical protein HKX48_000713 [Thoreauomyces humboldtii]|nr:hypothetical protein HKX48_000713 [Thoreauomyces humboldtii]